MLRDIQLNISYTSEEDDIYESFFIPVLANSVEYKRAVGYYSLGVLLNTPAAMSGIIENNGKIKIIFSKIVSKFDFNAIKDGYDYSFEDDEIPSFKEIVEYNDDSLLRYRVRLLAYLFNTGRLEMKVALRRQGMFHQKTGIMSDKYGNSISFSGSMNETTSALDPEYNSEEITVFKSWDVGQAQYVAKHSKDFDKLWANESSDATHVCDLPEIIRAELNIISLQDNFKPSFSEERRLLEKFINNDDNNRKKPKVPDKLFGQPFSMREHQINALKEWQQKGFQGILELATGTGKTITAIYAATKIIESNRGVSLIIVAPYIDLAEQWVNELKLFNINALKCYGNKKEWHPQLKKYFERNSDTQSEFIALVVVNKTFKNKPFQSLLSKFDFARTVFIGDECHHHSSQSFENKLPYDAAFKIGLSATPFHYIDEEANARLRNFYGDPVYSYSLYEAINNGILTPYEYHPIPVELTLDEADKYHELTDKIRQQFSYGQTNTTNKNEHLQALLMRRARLIGTATNKLLQLEKLIAENGVPSHSLFYCSDGSVQQDEFEFSDLSEAAPAETQNNEIKQRKAVGMLLRKNRISASPFTSDESSSQRKDILRAFKHGEVNALIAMKCLDEGIDVPACSTAFILASSRNPRQFIQRRGRILRRSPGKEKAVIYDFVVVLPKGQIDDAPREINFFQNELARVADFAKNSIHPLTSIKPLNPWLEAYDLFHLVV